VVSIVTEQEQNDVFDLKPALAILDPMYVARVEGSTDIGCANFRDEAIKFNRNICSLGPPIRIMAVNEEALTFWKHNDVVNFRLPFLVQPCLS
jgi:hypothetical protein